MMTTSLKIKMTGRQIKKPGTPVIGVPGSGVFLYGLLAEPTGRGTADNEEYEDEYKNRNTNQTQSLCIHQNGLLSGEVSV